MIALPSLTENKGFTCELSRVKGCLMPETTENALPDSRTDGDSSANILASAGQKLSTAFWRVSSAFTDALPYLVVPALALLATEAPYVSFLILAFLHLSSIDRNKKQEAFSTWLVNKTRQLEKTKQFVGDGFSVTNEQTWRINGKEYLVSVTRSKEAESAQ